MSRRLAPIVLFVYNRLEHARLTLTALQSNRLAAESQLIIYSDGPKTLDDEPAVVVLRQYLRTITGFKSVTIHEQPKNLGLAQSIQSGVTAVINEYERVIVLEDDVVVAPHFLEFMNEALERYQEQERVWHISGWNYPMKVSSRQNDANNSYANAGCFFSTQMNCWGWATWQDRWGYFTKDPDDLISRWGISDILRFNLYSPANFWRQVKHNAKGNLNTWAVFWYSTLFERKGLCLSPMQSLTQNIGHDGSGENCIESTEYSVKLAEHPVKTWPASIRVNKIAQAKIMLYFWHPSRLLKKIR
jgi:hypothetical protein